MKPSHRYFYVLVIGILAWPALASADQVTLKNGDRISGTIVSSDGKELAMKADLLGDVKVQWDAITSITTTQPIHVALKDGRTVVGTVTTTDASIVVATKDSGNVSAPRDTVLAVRNDAEEARYEIETHPRITQLWSGLVDLGFAATYGNSETSAFNLSGKAARVTSRSKISAYGTAIYAKTSTTGVAVTTAHAIRGGLRLDWNMNPRLFVFGLSDFEYDEFQGLNLRNVTGGGVGYHLYKRRDTFLDLNAGIAYEQAYFINSISRKSAEILVGQSFGTKIGSRLTISEQASIYPGVSGAESGEYRFAFDATGAVKLKNWLSWQMTYSDRFLSDPLFPLKRNDAIFTMGLRASFGRGVF
jgi:putative salt-induced outer membrane protein YdiY